MTHVFVFQSVDFWVRQSIMLQPVWVNMSLWAIRMCDVYVTRH